MLVHVELHSTIQIIIVGKQNEINFAHLQVSTYDNKDPNVGDVPHRPTMGRCADVQVQHCLVVQHAGRVARLHHSGIGAVGNGHRVTQGRAPSPAVTRLCIE